MYNSTSIKIFPLLLSKIGKSIEAKITLKLSSTSAGEDDEKYQLLGIGFLLGDKNVLNLYYGDQCVTL